MRRLDLNFDQIDSPFEHKIYCNKSDTIMVQEHSKTDIRIYTDKFISYEDIREITSIFFRSGVKAFIELNNGALIDNGKKRDIKVIGIEGLK